MSISNWFVKLVGIIIVIFGLFVLIDTNFRAFDILFALHFIGGLLLIGAGIVIIKGGIIDL